MSSTLAASANIGLRLTATAEEMPDAAAVVVQGRRGWRRPVAYRSFTFAELDADSDRLARGLWAIGVTAGTRLALLVRPGYEFVALVFALFKSGAVSILIDPGMGRSNLLRCLDQAHPQGFVAIPIVQAIRRLMGRRFAAAKFNVTVGTSWLGGGVSLDRLRRLGAEERMERPAPTCRPEDPAAIIFTSGSTGPPKGVLYRHGNFGAQVDQIRDQYGIQPGGVDLACFPLFGLFNCAMGVTTVIPDMDASRPASADPARLVEAVKTCRVTQSFASPAVWDRVGRYCESNATVLPGLRRVFSSGAPVSPDVIRRMKACIHPQGEVHTPYGATEALPVSTIEAGEVLRETGQRWRSGAGTCVGSRFSEIEWKVIPIVDGPIGTIESLNDLPPGEIGELIVRAPQVTREYFENPCANDLGKIEDPCGRWHRMGDVGYFDEQARFWFCGRLGQRVVTPRGTLFTDPCEGVFNDHPDVRRSALVGVGPAGCALPVIVIEPEPGKWRHRKRAHDRFVEELRVLARKHPHTAGIEFFLFRRRFPVDVRHNAKIFRERLAVWAARQIRTARARGGETGDGAAGGGTS